ncbi:uncharacterized protein LOC126328694 [Schistocerca gregaria]|uniref:uncharacterized protein LOC126328694 n=1 Tax=Schistocerca gregaria TaxID=7010 RepID=UPI00211E2407|nr:uncharacterized protein LOC126328694 [Schistocerca gregaria]
MRYVTAAVKARVGQGQSCCSYVRLTDGNTCHLLGELRDDNNRVPDEIKRKFCNGVPRCWRHCCSEWTKNKVTWMSAKQVLRVRRSSWCNRLTPDGLYWNHKNATISETGKNRHSGHRHRASWNAVTSVLCQN